MDSKDLTIATTIATIGSALLNHWLSTSAKRQEIRYQRFYERKARIIAGTYKRLERFLVAVEGLIRNDDEVIYPKVQELAKEFKTYYFENAIYYPNDWDKRVRVIEIILKTIATFYSSRRTLGAQPEASEALQKEINPYLTQARKVRDHLRKDFHNVLLGRDRSGYRKALSVRTVLRGSWKRIRGLFTRKTDQEPKRLFPRAPEKSTD